MNHLIILLFILSNCINLIAQAPNAKEWTKQKKTQRNYLLRQIEALQVQLQYVKTGYKIVDKGLTTVGEIKEGTHDLDKDYFNSLKEVNPLIRKSPKVNQILINQQLILNEFNDLVAYCKQDAHYTKSEINHVTRVYEGIRSHGQMVISELTLITTAGQTEMTDDERLARLEKAHEEMMDQFAFTKNFAASTKMLAIERAKEQQQIKNLRKLNGIHKD